MGRDVSKWAKERLRLKAKNLRKNPTYAQKVLWDNLRRLRMHAFLFEQQKIIDEYIFNFICEEAKLVIEVFDCDEDFYSEYDSEKEKIINIKGYIVMCFCEDEIVNDLITVLAGIYDMCMRRIEEI